jgi:hypothetical protein
MKRLYAEDRGSENQQYASAPAMLINFKPLFLGEIVRNNPLQFEHSLACNTHAMVDHIFCEHGAVDENNFCLNLLRVIQSLAAKRRGSYKNTFSRR